MVFYNEERMGKNRKKKTSGTPPSEPRREMPHQNIRRGGRWIAVALLVLGTGVFLYALSSEPPPVSEAPAVSASRGSAPAPPQRSASQSRRYRYFESADDAHPLPETLPPTEFQNAGIANAYAIARDIPEVLAQQPCLCGCDNPSDDHRSLLDCYIDEHAAMCMVCLKEAVFAKQMTEAGKSASWIRDAIVRHEFSDVYVGN